MTPQGWRAGALSCRALCGCRLPGLRRIGTQRPSRRCRPRASSVWAGAARGAQVRPWPVAAALAAGEAREGQRPAAWLSSRLSAPGPGIGRRLEESVNDHASLEQAGQRNEEVLLSARSRALPASACQSVHSAGANGCCPVGSAARANVAVLHAAHNGQSLLFQRKRTAQDRSPIPKNYG